MKSILHSSNEIKLCTIHLYSWIIKTGPKTYIYLFSQAITFEYDKVKVIVPCLLLNEGALGVVVDIQILSCALNDVKLKSLPLQPDRLQ